MQERLCISTKGRQLINITDAVNQFLSNSHLKTALCHLFLQHTSASLLITENADSAVLKDIEYYLQKNVIDGDSGFRHRLEGDDDMSAHIRSLLMGTTLTIPVKNKQLNLGVWQGVFLYEHRTQPQKRFVVITTIAA